VQAGTGARPAPGSGGTGARAAPALGPLSDLDRRTRTFSGACFQASRAPESFHPAGAGARQLQRPPQPSKLLTSGNVAERCISAGGRASVCRRRDACPRPALPWRRTAALLPPGCG